MYAPRVHLRKGAPTPHYHFYLVFAQQKQQINICACLPLTASSWSLPACFSNSSAAIFTESRAACRISMSSSIAWKQDNVIASVSLTSLLLRNNHSNVCSCLSTCWITYTHAYTHTHSHKETHPHTCTHTHKMLKNKKTATPIQCVHT